MSLPSPRWARLSRAATVAVLATSGAVALAPTTASAAAPGGAIVDDAGCTTSSMGLNDDDTDGPITLTSPVSLPGVELDQAYVSNNGYLYFQDASHYAQFSAFTTDLDSRNTGTATTYGEATFESRPALCVNWFDIGYFNQGTDYHSDIQALLVDRSDLQPGDFDVVYNFGRIESGAERYITVGVETSFADSETPATSDFLPGSGDNAGAAFADTNTETGLVHGSRESDVLGRYVFRFRDGVLAPSTPPESEITSHPAATSSSSATFGYTASSGVADDHVSFECRLTTAPAAPGAFASCPTGGTTYTGLAVGAHTFEVRAVGRLGGTDRTPASYDFTVAPPAPDNGALPSITAAVTSKHAITSFGWYRDGVTITYACNGNGSALAASCPAPRVVPRAQEGRTFKATVTTVDGDSATVSTRLYIDKGNPRVAVKGFSGKRVYTSLPKHVRCVASDPRSGLDDCTVSVKKVTRKNGEKRVVVVATATDKAGNVKVLKKKASFKA